jgi:hypothetical protein
VGQHIIDFPSAAGNASLKLFFEPYNPNWSLTERVAYVARQWFQIGSVLGPVLVDILLSICSMGQTAYLSAASKLAKLEKLGEALRFTKVTEKMLETYKCVGRIRQCIPPKLIKIVQDLIEMLSTAMGVVKDQVIGKLKLIHDALPGSQGVDWVKISKFVYEAYDKCSTINFFVGMILLFTGNSDITEEGEVVPFTGDLQSQPI